ncbi:hypothetical protein FQZ97_1150300 [compost metagenome]
MLALSTSALSRVPVRDWAVSVSATVVLTSPVIVAASFTALTLTVTVAALEVRLPSVTV